MKKFAMVISFILVVLVGFCGGFAYNFYITQPQSETFASGEIDFHFLQLGNAYAGDSIFIQCGDYDILIDAGSMTSSASVIIDYVDQYVTDGKLEFVIATHADQDHIAAFPSSSSTEGIFEHYQVDTIIDFPKTNKTTQTYQNYVSARDEEVKQGAKHYTALQCYNGQGGGQREYALSGGVSMEILYNYYYENPSTDENNYSVCLMFNQGDNHFIFTGDLEKGGEAKLIEYYQGIGRPLPKCQLYKAGHHGSPTSSTAEFMAVIQPQIVVASCSAGSDEYTTNTQNQFPSQQFIDNVAPYTDKVYVPTMSVYRQQDGKTVESFQPLNGNVVVKATRSEIKVECSASNTILKDTAWFASNRTMPSAWAC